MYTPTFVILLASLFHLTTSLTIDILPTPTPTKMPAVKPEIAQIIQDKKLKYARYADTHQWEKFNEVAWPDCTYNYKDHDEIIVDHGFTYSWNSTAEFTAFFSMAFSTLQTSHHVGPGEFTWVSCDQVDAIFPIVYYSGLAKGVNSTQGVTGVGAGHYFNSYTRNGSDWLMSSCSFNRIYEQ
ncbi:putative bile acid 7-alpha protein [Phaeoacremonium minimum UCRPA7]|uniref:Putative bile acid 7-alpha protein n=1 Tax=Phaeoacremonium minimum (strain UCR-PA7) TaxID=1286976 RepID=R8BNJ6_PHAM7|nr:putative bile acid 7-alpha protein [Phaeoacremonium minimum UCRPA7]EOO00911.1 putative bile acid 7-alpha protein [Phaeoacremonium minimum UCRPA7]